MADNRQYTALEWVLTEIQDTLSESQRVLESYANDPQDITQLRFCQTLIHQVYGSLHMVGFEGAALLSQEMELLTQALLDRDVLAHDEALEVLMRSVLQLPNYLEQVQTSHQDNAGVVLSLLNDLRSVRGAPLLSESSLFTPNLSAAYEIHGRPVAITKNQQQFVALIAKLKKMFQFAAVCVINQKNTDENLNYLLKVSDRLKKVLSGTKRYAVWDITFVVIEGIIQKNIAFTPALKNLLRDLDQEIRALESSGIKSLESFSSEDLLKNLLYYISTADSLSPAIEQVKRQYQLDKMSSPAAQGEQKSSALKGIDSATIDAVRKAINEEFSQIKAALDESLRDQEQSENFDLMQNGLQRINDTLAILGVDEIRQSVNNTIIKFANFRREADVVPADVLIDFANDLIEIEVELENTLGRTDGQNLQLNSAQIAVLEECRNGLEKAKDAIIEYIACKWDVEKLNSVPQFMREVRGSLSMMDLDRAAEILSSCVFYIESKLMKSGFQPNWQELDNLADVIASVDYYLEFMSAARESDETILEKAEEGLLQLGVQKGEVTSLTHFREASGDKTEQDLLDQVEVEEEPLVDTVEEENEEDPIDEEVVEIFVEEVAEIQETLKEFVPQWTENLSNDDALGEIRRAFHTLKGSGRMVGATDIGELGWSIENMLNRVIDKTINPLHLQIDLINEVIKILPEMVSAFQNRSPNPQKENSDRFMEWGHLLSKGETTTDLVKYLSATEEAEDGEHEIDAQLWEIFTQEARSHLDVVNEFIAHTENIKPLFEPPSDPMQRALHTLKGSAYMAELTPIAELMAPLEKFAKELRSYQVPIDEDIFQLIKDGVTYTEEALKQIDQLIYPVIPKFDQFLARIDELRERSVAPLIRQKEAEKAQIKVDPAVLEVLMAEGMVLLLDADLTIEEWQQDSPALNELIPIKEELAVLAHGAERANLGTMADLCRSLERVYQGMVDGQVSLQNATWTALLNGHSELMDIVDGIAAGQDLPPVNEPLLAELSSLTELVIDSSGIGEPEAGEEFGEKGVVDSNLSELADSENDLTPSEIILEEVPENYFDSVNLDLSDDSEPTGDEVGDFNTERLTTDSSNEINLDDSEIVLEEVPSDYFDSLSLDQNDDSSITSQPSLENNELSEVSASSELDQPASTTSAFDEEFDAETGEIFLEEANELLDSIEQSLGDWETDEESESYNLAIQRDLHTFKGGARLAGLMNLGELSHQFESYLIAHQFQSLPSDFFSQAHNYQAELHRHVDQFTQKMSGELEESVSDSSELDFPIVEEPVDSVVDTPEQSSSITETEAPAVTSAASTESSIEDDFDPDTAEIFLEEANELLEEIDESIADWEGAGDAIAASEVMKRALHTFKGGARLAGLMNLGELAHDFETYLINQADVSAYGDFFPNVHQFQDQLIQQIEHLKTRLDPDGHDEQTASGSANDESSAMDSDVSDNVAPIQSPESSIPPVTNRDSVTNIVPFVGKSTGLDALKTVTQTQPVAPATGGGIAAARRAQPQETVKVAADLMEELVNLAGETSISRGRMEEQISDLGFSLDEMESTVRRLQEQLRRLDIETEAQVLFRQEQLSETEDFDPLEMDRYSALQQLSRSLIESASDLLDLKETLSNKTRDAETVLLQQSRINTDLQEGLMRSRMVPFSRIVPRLRRIVRQISGELNKDVELQLGNMEGELDRSMMERMVAPLEHMLRNAIDHGIEDAETRLGAGKSPTGRIVISLDRDGGDVLIHVADDGRGINVQRVREKAIERQLLSEDSVLSDQEVLQFILHAGFSTAEKVTQISGRGVGMDVVNSEISQMGGSVAIDSQEGKGTAFTIRVPFTVSVNRALMIAMGDDRYAIPLNTIEGIVRVSPYELEYYYSNPDQQFEYAGQAYDLRYLGSLLDENAVPRLQGHTLPLPVLLVRSSEHSFAIQVDNLQGSREIVVKSLGPQFRSVQGMSGATIMGDGHVVVILDLNSMIRRTAALNLPAQMDLETPAISHNATPLVMVVDDSVTVRKVTSRLLEREGYEVITAKDGLDAIAILQDHRPDIMLLDIEMPRMDGFEVAKNVRSSSDYGDLPIIMITSRTGEKHRQRGLESGANMYMGKPYVEDELLTNIRSLLGVTEDVVS